MAHSIKAPHCGSWISLKALDLYPDSASVVGSSTG
uniref:Uncharacterized protein n=1 Tax=Anguilla anguilla TaxID=7936 RepID=A0A0E9V1B9_ANGAN